MQKKVVISGYYGFGNFGDEAILAVLVQHLKQLNCEINVISSNPQKTSSEHLVNSVRTFDLKNIIRIIKNSDILISGGGSLLQDVTSIKSILYYLFIILIAQLNNKKVIIFSQGIGPIKNKFAQLVTKNLLKKCSYISVRDNNSKTLLENWGIESELLCDPIFSLKVDSLNKTGIVGVQLRDFVTMNDSFLNKLAQKITEEFPDKRIKILSLQESIDKEICQKFCSILKKLNPNIKVEVIDNDIINNILELEYLIAMRFHSILIAIIAGLKCLAINYDIKVEKLATDAQIPILSLISPDNLNKAFQDMKEIETDKLKSFASKKEFHWENIDNILK